jgi:hypothetical protein
MDSAELLNELLDLEHCGWKSLCDSTGADFYGSLMTQDAVMVLAHGFVWNRDAVVASLSDAPPWRTYEIRNPRVIGAGTDVAILVYTGVAFRAEDAPAFSGLMTSVYVRANGTWKLALYQQTPIPSVEQQVGDPS